VVLLALAEVPPLDVLPLDVLLGLALELPRELMAPLELLPPDGALTELAGLWLAE
jgi:hypothetical protein